jgi:pimeloyl-ACP methyl ester carboxylesterase
MASFERDGTTIHYDLEGDGEPVLLLAPGGMRSHNALWENVVWNPRERLAPHRRLIGMDQRNAGRSTAPVSATDSWADYTADQLALLDHLGVERCHVLGMCIGGPFILALLTAAPERFAGAVLLQPAGATGPTPLFRDMYDGWAREQAASHPEATPDDWDAFRENLWSGDFLYSVTPEQVAEVATPLLVLLGNDEYHPSELSRAIVELAPDAELVERWKEPELVDDVDRRVLDFLAAHPIQGGANRS